MSKYVCSVFGHDFDPATAETFTVEAPSQEVAAYTAVGNWVASEEPDEFSYTTENVAVRAEDSADWQCYQVTLRVIAFD